MSWLCLWWNGFTGIIDPGMLLISGEYMFFIYRSYKNFIFFADIFMLDRINNYPRFKNSKGKFFRNHKNRFVPSYKLVEKIFIPRYEVVNYSFSSGEWSGSHLVY